MQRYKLIVAYDGANYHGWQCQEGLPTVAGTLEHAFARVFNKSIKLLAASRTDAGVHALGQHASFDIEPFVDCAAMLKAWNHALPADIHIRDLQLMERTANLFEVKSKIYFYHFFLDRPLPGLSRYGWYYYKKISIDKLRDTLNQFVGTHDFRAFSTGDDRGDDTIRTIDSIQLIYFSRFKMYRVVVTGKKFLHHMIRRIVGASLDIASRPAVPVDYVGKNFAQKKPCSSLTNAPAHGLVLYKITY